MREAVTSFHCPNAVEIYITDFVVSSPRLYNNNNTSKIMLLPCRYMSLLARHLSDERADDKTEGGPQLGVGENGGEGSCKLTVEPM
jgi:hypothetical protein